MNPLSKTVELTEDQLGLKWPVVFLYPEFGQTDFVESFDESSTYALTNKAHFLIYQYKFSIIYLKI